MSRKMVQIPDRTHKLITDRQGDRTITKTIEHIVDEYELAKSKVDVHILNVNAMTLAMQEIKNILNSLTLPVYTPTQSEWIRDRLKLNELEALYTRYDDMAIYMNRQTLQTDFKMLVGHTEDRPRKDNPERTELVNIAYDGSFNDKFLVPITREQIEAIQKMADDDLALAQRYNH